MNVELLLTLATLVNRAVEAIKRFPAFDRVPTEWRDEVLLIVSTILGILAVGFLAPDQNLLADVPGVHPLAGTLFTGAIVAAGSNAIHFVIDLMNKRATPVNTNVNIAAESDSRAATKIVDAVQEQTAAAA